MPTQCKCNRNDWLYVSPFICTKAVLLYQKEGSWEETEESPSPPLALIWNHVSLDLRFSLGINVADTFIQLLSLI